MTNHITAKNCQETSKQSKQKYKRWERQRRRNAFTPWTTFCRGSCKGYSHSSHCCSGFLISTFTVWLVFHTKFPFCWRATVGPFSFSSCLVEPLGVWIQIASNGRQDRGRWSDVPTTVLHGHSPDGPCVWSVMKQRWLLYSHTRNRWSW